MHWTTSAGTYKPVGMLRYQQLKIELSLTDQSSAQVEIKSEKEWCVIKWHKQMREISRKKSLERVQYLQPYGTTRAKKQMESSQNTEPSLLSAVTRTRPENGRVLILYV